MTNCKCRDCREARITRKAARAPGLDYEQEHDGPNRRDSSEGWREHYARVVYRPLEGPHGSPGFSWNIADIGPLEGLSRLRKH